MKQFVRVLSTFLVLALLMQMLPMSIFAEQLQNNVIAELQPAEPEAEVSVLHEITNKRTQYTKEFLLSNGLHLAVAYPEPVHYEKDGAWESIDNSLKAGDDGTYTNTAGRWQVSFPQQIGSGQTVTVTKDGYTLSFGMPQRLTNEGSSLMSIGTEATATTQAATSTAQIQTSFDVTAEKEAAEYPETVVEKLSSRLTYESIHSDTNVIYDLTGEKVKESVVIKSYDSTLRGYRYTLNVGSMIPVLADEGHITFYDETQTNVIMVMPAPYMVDAAMEISTDVTVSLSGSGSVYTLTYTLPTDWLASGDRQWPVILDPVIQAETDESNIQDITLSPNCSYDADADHLDIGYATSTGEKRTFLNYSTLPLLFAGDVIVSAAVSMEMMTELEEDLLIEVHKVLNVWDSQTIAWDTMPEHNADIEDYVLCREQGSYTWDVTDLVRQWYATGVNTGILFKAHNSAGDGQEDIFAQFCSSQNESASKPSLQIMFRNSNGLESYWDYTSATAGSAGTAYINNYSGNLVYEHSDLGFDGNRMPVTITHYYNANDSQYNLFGMGYGWRTNFNQLLYIWTDAQCYVWNDSDGTSHYFKACGRNAFEDEEGLGLTLIKKSGLGYEYVITDQSGNTSYFDRVGRLVKISNSQSAASSITIAYTDDYNLYISSVTDGAGRVYLFQYTNYLLSKISYMGTGDCELCCTTYTYIGTCLFKIQDADGRATNFNYRGRIMTETWDSDGYKLRFSHNIEESDFAPCRVTKIEEYDGTLAGNFIVLSYANNQTTLSDKLGNTQIIQFNNWGNTVSVQDDQGHAQYAVYDTDINGDNGKGNQLMLSSKLQNTVSNLLGDSSFENNTLWTSGGASQMSCSIVSDGYLGNKSLYMSGASFDALHSPTFTAEANASYTFSGYVKTTTGNVKLGIYQNADNAVYSDPVSTGGEWARVQVSYTNDTDAAQTLSACILGLNGAAVYLDCVQVEKAATASRYNLIDNGDFQNGNDGWTATGTSSDDGIVTVSADAPQLDDNAYRLTGDPFAQKSISQTLPISGTAGDSFVVAGWAKGDSVPLTTQDERGRDFAIRLIFNYTQPDSEEERSYASAQFNPDTDSTVRWQYSAVEAVAEGDYNSVTVQLVYDYNANTVCFDGIQLYKEEFGTVYTYDDNGNVTGITDEQGQTTIYEYTGNDLTGETLSSGEESAYTYDVCHNLLTEVSSDGTTTTYTYDAYGNNTSVTVTGGESGKSITTYATYTADGNYLASTTDALGKVTTYSYDSETGVLEWVQYPNDTEATRTTYTYDSMYRMVGAAATTNTGLRLSANYTYTDDQLAALQTPSTTYTFTYGDFSLAESVKIGSRTLVTYTYDAYNRLKVLDYGNDGAVEYTYDAQGNVVKETYEDGATVSYRYDNDGALSKVIDSATGITTTYYYDFSGRLMKYTETGTDYSHSVSYTYSDTGNLLSQSETVNGVTTTYSYIYDDQNRVSSMTVGDTTVTYTYDEFGRVSRKTAQQGDRVFIDNTVSYTGSDTATSEQISVYNGYTYTYDDNGNILSVSDGTNTTSYVYDSQNQLIRENNQALGKTWCYHYNAGGNLLTKLEYDYTTGDVGSVIKPYLYHFTDSEWGDLLTAYNAAFEYDEIGNILSDGTWTYTWKHGRQLESMTKGDTTWIYTYDANGMRTKCSNGNAQDEYTYVYNGNLLVRMVVQGITLDFTYDASGSPLTISMDGYVYYYKTNLQGDVVGILNQNGVRVVTYTYDAWGNMTYSASDQIAEYNPLTYRGYVYDRWSGLYYLQSRYYNPEWGRFINPEPNVYQGAFDENAGLIGYNVFAYCANNPVLFKDVTGEGITLVCVLIGAGVGLIIGAVGGSHYAKHNKCLTPNDGWNYWKYVVSFGVVGGSIGALVGWGASALVARYGVATAARSITRGGGARFSSFSALKRSLGSAGKGKQWHHIVEQCQIGKSGFSKYWIQNSNNVINISNSVHSKVSAYYNSAHRFTNGMRFRDWLSGQSFKTQYEWGIKVLRMYGVKI